MPRNASTSPDDGLRYYVWNKRRLLSVTSIRKVIGMPFPLHNWVVKQVIDSAMALAPTIAAADLSDEKVTKETRSLIRKNGMQERDTAADKGSAIHDAADQRADPEAVDPTFAPYLRNLYDAEKVLGMRRLLSEAQVFNLTLGYAGSLDWLGTIFTGTIDESLAIIDFKTGKGVYIDHLLQTLAYSMGEFVGRDDVVDESGTDLLHKVQSLYILHLSETGWELLEVNPDQKVWRAFTDMVSLANWLKDNDSIDPFISRRLNGAA